jgi:hypothetical protein
LQHVRHSGVGSAVPMSDIRDIRRQLELARRLSLLAGDSTTRRRLLEYRDELIEALERYPERREQITPQQVRQRAHDLWEQEGCPQGRDKEFWLRAERELVEGYQSH